METFRKVKKTNRNTIFITIITENGLISIIYKEQQRKRSSNKQKNEHKT